MGTFCFLPRWFYSNNIGKKTIHLFHWFEELLCVIFSTQDTDNIYKHTDTRKKAWRVDAHVLLYFLFCLFWHMMLLVVHCITATMRANNFTFFKAYLYCLSWLNIIKTLPSKRPRMPWEAGLWQKWARARKLFPHKLECYEQLWKKCKQLCIRTGYSKTLSCIRHMEVLLRPDVNHRSIFVCLWTLWKCLLWACYIYSNAAVAEHPISIINIVRTSMLLIISKFLWMRYEFYLRENGKIKHFMQIWEIYSKFRFPFS